jgi:hypothetical protein
MRSSRVGGWDLTKWLERLSASAKVATVLGSIPASSDTVEFEGRKMKQCWIKYNMWRKKSKKPPVITQLAIALVHPYDKLEKNDKLALYTYFLTDTGSEPTWHEEYWMTIWCRDGSSYPGNRCDRPAGRQVAWSGRAECCWRVRAAGRGSSNTARLLGGAHNSIKDYTTWKMQHE